VRTFPRRIAGGLLAALLLTACNTVAAPPPSDDRVVKIGFIDELVGEVSGPGQGAKNSADLAIRQANDANAVPGYTLELVAGHAEKPEEGADVTTRFAADPQLVGLIGASSSTVSRATIPILAKRNIVQISFSNTNPTLSLGPYPTAPRRVFANFFRVVANDLLQGQFAASYARERANVRTVATVNDQKPYGLGLVAAFEKEFTNRGGTVVSSRFVKEDDLSGIRSVAGRIAAQGPDLVYYAGEYDEGSALLRQLRNAGYTRPMMAGDTLYREDALDLGADAEGMFATSVGAPLEQLGSAKQFIADYRETAYKKPYSTYGGQSYDATRILIRAIAEVLPEAGSVEQARPRIIEAVGRTSNFSGATGTHTFDQFGDTSNKALTMYKVTGDRWRSIFSAVFE
jgi:branched-chain amino acid transport system substrate-binding protein